MTDEELKRETRYGDTWALAKRISNIAKTKIKVKNEDINPHRGEGELWLLYTTVEGGNFETVLFTQKKYLTLIERGYFEMRVRDRSIDKIYPAYALLVRGIDGYDFVLKKINDESRKYAEN